MKKGVWQKEQGRLDRRIIGRSMAFCIGGAGLAQSGSVDDRAGGGVRGGRTVLRMLIRRRQGKRPRGPGVGSQKQGDEGLLELARRVGIVARLARPFAVTEQGGSPLPAHLLRSRCRAAEAADRTWNRAVNWRTKGTSASGNTEGTPAGA